MTRRESNIAPPFTLVQISGALSLSGCLIGLAILLFSCAGFDAALAFSILPIVIGVVGGSLTIASHRRTVPDSSTLASLFIAALAILGGLLEAAAWLGWPILFNQHG